MAEPSTNADVWLVVPVFNEGQVIREVATHARATFPNIVCVDDGSSDESVAEIRAVIARHAQDADEMPDPGAPTKRAEVFSTVYRAVLGAQRAALIAELEDGRIEDEAVRAMLERLDLQEASVTARLESRL